MPKKVSSKEEEQDLEKTVKLDIDKINEEDMYSKIEKVAKEESKKETKSDKPEEKLKADIDLSKEGVTLTEVVSNINEEKGKIQNPSIVEKKSPFLSIILIVLGIVIIWSILYYLFLSPDAYLKKNNLDETKDVTNTTETTIDNSTLDEEDSTEMLVAEASAQNFVDAATLWYTEALMRYGSLTDVNVLADGSIVKLNSSDSFNLKAEEKVNVKGSYPTSINSMIISKEGIIVISQIKFDNYCFDYDGENLINIKC